MQYSKRQTHYYTESDDKQNNCSITSKHQQRQPRFRHHCHWLGGFVSCVLALSSIQALPAAAAEQLIIKVGPIHRSVPVKDLEQFTQTGKIPPSLKSYRLLLTPQVKQLLNRQLKIDSSVVDKFLNELLKSKDGQRLLKHLYVALPDTSVQQLKIALAESLQQAKGLSAMSFFQAYPAEHIEIDAAAAINMFIQLNASYLQNQVLSPLLERELFVSDGHSLPTNLNPSASGTQRVLRRTLSLYDRDRERKIPLDLYYSDESSGPLVVMSHGFAADRKFLAYLAKHLTSHGLSVVSLEHPGSNIDSLSEIALSLSPDNFLAASEFIDRPKDVTFVLNELEKLSQHWGKLKDKFNTKQVTVVGHSLGGYTALALAGGQLNLAELRSFCHNYSTLGRSPADWLQCAAADLPNNKLRLRDRRVAQAIAFNPVIGKLFGERGLQQVVTPTMMLMGSKDTVTPALYHQLKPFTQLKREKYLLAAIGGTHMSVTDLGNLNSHVGQSTLVPELMGKQAKPVREFLQGVTFSFVQQLTPEADQYRTFLQPGYAQSLIPFPEIVEQGQAPTLQLRLATDVPVKVERWLDILALGNQKINYQKPPQQEIATRQLSISTIASRLLGSRRILPQAEYCTGKLNSYFTTRLGKYRRYLKNIS